MNKNTGYFEDDGMVSSQRNIKALNADYFKIDERTEEDLLAFLFQLSKRINYYYVNEGKQVKDDWIDLFTSDFYFLLKLFLKYDLNGHLQEYVGRKKAVVVSLQKGDKEITEMEVKSLLLFLYDFTLDQKNFLHKFNNYEKSLLNENVLTQINKINNAGITENNALTSASDIYKFEIVQLLLINNQAVNRFGIAVDISAKINKELFEYISDKIRDEIESEVKGYLAGPDRFFTEESFKLYDELFTQLATKFNIVSNALQKYTKGTQEVEPVGLNPNTGLILAFLDLFNLVQGQINKISYRHLDFYYTKFLGLSKKEKAADIVHIILEPSPNADKTELVKGEMIVVKSKEKADLYIELDYDVTITQALVKELKSLFVCSSVKLSSKPQLTEKDVIEKRVFVADNTPHIPSQFAKNRKNAKSWMLFGEDQQSLSEEQRTMVSADMATLIFSPVLFARDGKRKFSVRLFFKNDFYAKIVDSIDDYVSLELNNGEKKADENRSNDKNWKNEGVFNGILNNTFLLDITAVSGWHRLQIYSSSFKSGIDTKSENGQRKNANDEDSYIELSFTLKSEVEPVDVYNPKVHGTIPPYDLTLTYPAIKVSLNNDSFFNAFSFFENVELKRVSIETVVEKSSDLKIQNNIGLVKMGNPFQLFGPQPTVGSFVNIKNTNIFNKFTTRYNLRLGWYDLPKEKNGFTSYFRAYNKNIHNSSFRINLSTLNQGSFTDPGKRIETGLFTTDSGANDDYLPDEKVIRVDPLKKDSFTCSPLLKNEQNISEANFIEGAVKLELIAPDDAFGHKTFPQVFPEVILNNSKWYNRSKPVPNPPLAPQVKYINVDYALKCDEVLNNSLKSDSNSDVILIHKYPFGYRKVFPDKSVEKITFLPSFEKSCNLYIGIENVKRGERLNLYFELEDSEKNNTEDEPSKIEWRYLINNEWKPFKSTDIIFDTTHQLVHSGIICFELPTQNSEFIGTNTILNPQLFWIKGSCESNDNISVRVSAVFAQGVQASRVVSANDTEMVLYRDSTMEFKRKIPNIKNIWQPFPSFKGRLGETDQQFYLRVSERLRHKNRMITKNDICQMVLEKFPEILKVKCISLDGSKENHHLKVIVMPRKYLSYEEYLNYLPIRKVSFATLIEIQNFIKAHISPFVSVKVENPEYEKVKVLCEVEFSRTGNYISQLNRDIIDIIWPWLNQEVDDMNCLSELYQSDILNKIKDLPYVKRVSEFSIVHFYSQNNDGRKYYTFEDSVKNPDMKIIKLFAPDAILVPSQFHYIKEITAMNPVAMFKLQPFIKQLKLLVIKKAWDKLAKTAESAKKEADSIQAANLSSLLEELVSNLNKLLELISDVTKERKNKEINDKIIYINVNVTYIITLFSGEAGISHLILGDEFVIGKGKEKFRNEESKVEFQDEPPASGLPNVSKQLPVAYFNFNQK